MPRRKFKIGQMVQVKVGRMTGKRGRIIAYRSGSRYPYVIDFLAFGKEAFKPKELERVSCPHNRKEK